MQCNDYSSDSYMVIVDRVATKMSTSINDNSYSGMQVIWYPINRYCFTGGFVPATQWGNATPQGTISLMIYHRGVSIHRDTGARRTNI